MGHKEELNLLSDFSYFGLTTLFGKQTLGEEYCDIMQIEGKNSLPLVVEERIFLILFHILVPYLLNRLNSWATSLNRIDIPGNEASRNSDRNAFLSDSRKKKLASVLPRVISFLGILKRVHVALFFFNGEFYHISKRVLNIRYVRFDHSGTFFRLTI